MTCRSLIRYLARDVTIPPIPPWRSLTNLSLKEVPLEKSKDEYSPMELNRITRETLDNLIPVHDITAYTDGSTSSDQTRGGAGVYVENKEGDVLWEESFPAGEICSSYTGECVAALKALEWIGEMRHRECLIVTDSKSLQEALRKNNWRDTDPWMKKVKKTLFELDSSITLLWIPSHIGIHGNDRADALAAAGTLLEQQHIPVTPAIVKAKIKAQKWKIKHNRAASIYGNKRSPNFEVESKWPRDVRRTFCQLRTEHCKELEYYMYLIDQVDNPYCDCGMGEEETLEHILCRCPALEERRQRMAGGQVTIDQMLTDS